MHYNCANNSKISCHSFRQSFIFALLQEALSIEANHVKALGRRGFACEKLGKTYEAALDFEKALRMEPRNIELRQVFQTPNDHICHVHIKSNPF